MAFNSEARSRLQKFVGAARKIIEQDFLSQLQSNFGLNPLDGSVAKLEDLEHLNTTNFETASDFRVILEHYRRQEKEKADDRALLRRILREQTQTFLNRICAIRMAENRGVLAESLASGMQSGGFQKYRLVVGAGLGSDFEAYEKYLKSVFDELALDLPQIFDRTLPFGLLFLGEAAFTELLGELNAGDMESFWGEDETLGWIFQYFNSDEDFAEMRGQQNKNPKNSHELAVRNQFFTPRYVVEFLLDNSLGRLWCEETGGKTRLMECCSYLTGKDQFTGGFEQLRDPRTIRVLDPACGSMHFGLYAFDLLFRIYEECWDWVEEAPDNHRLKATDFENNQCFPPLFSKYACKEDFLRSVPSLIIQHNIYGADIDVRATQIAGLALWLRAQKALAELEVPLAERGMIGRARVTAAVAPPPELEIEAVLNRTSNPNAIAGLKALKLDYLSLAPEAGLLLKLEADLEDATRAAKGALGTQFGLDGLPEDPQGQLFEDSTWSDKRKAVEQVLKAYADGAGHSFKERLYASDASECLNLIDLCTKKFDVIVMNPPFGAPSDGCREILGKTYPHSKKDLIGMFVTRMLSLLKKHCGYLGTISSRTIFFQGSFEKWREKTLFDQAKMPIFLDLGLGVMDNALVEAAAYVLGYGKSHGETRFINATGEKDKSEELVRRRMNDSSACFGRTLGEFSGVPGKVLVYYANQHIVDAYSSSDFGRMSEVKVGTQTSNNDRYVRLFWEVERASKNWVPLSKGGEARPFYGDVPTEINWQNAGDEVKADICFKYPYLKGNYSFVVKNETAYFRPGLTWSFRAQSLELRAFPKGGIFDRVGSCAFVENDSEEDLLTALAVTNSRAFQNLISVQNQRLEGDSHYECGMVSNVPCPSLSDSQKEKLAALALQNFEARRRLDTVNEESRAFILPEIIQEANGDLDRDSELEVIRSSQDEMDRDADDAYGFVSDIIAKQEKSRALPVPTEEEKLDRLLSWAVGVAFGRFDLRLATGDRDIPPLGRPFNPYPDRAPGRLPEGDEPFIPNAGIFVMDSSHPMDLTRAVRSVLDELGLGSDIDVGAWLEKDFFKFHLGAYSGAARCAPIYWPIGTSSGNYVLWVYYPALSERLLWTAVNDFVERKRAEELRASEVLHQKAALTDAERREVEKHEALAAELLQLAGQLRSLAQNFKAHFDDGVAVNAVRFMPLIQSREWLKKLEKTKIALEKGGLDWSETAADLWPERVKKACGKDPSLRLAHKARGWFEEG